jgi:hypothetical protein
LFTLAEKKDITFRPTPLLAYVPLIFAAASESCLYLPFRSTDADDDDDDTMRYVYSSYLFFYVRAQTTTNGNNKGIFCTMRPGKNDWNPTSLLPSFVFIEFRLSASFVYQRHHNKRFPLSSTQNAADADTHHLSFLRACIDDLGYDNGHDLGYDLGHDLGRHGQEEEGGRDGLSRKMRSWLLQAPLESFIFCHLLNLTRGSIFTLAKVLCDSRNIRRKHLCHWTLYETLLDFLSLLCSSKTWVGNASGSCNRSTSKIGNLN